MKLHIKYRNNGGHSNYTNVQHLVVTDELVIQEIGVDTQAVIPRDEVQSIESISFHNTVKLHPDDSNWLEHLKTLARDLRSQRNYTIADELETAISLINALASGRYSSELGIVD